MDNELELKKRVVKLLQGKGAHIDFEGAIAGFAEKLRGEKHSQIPYTVWQILEHLRIAQWDILEFSRNPNHQSPKWPEGYWPESEAPPESESWDRSVAAFRQDLQEMQDLVANPETDLYIKIPHGNGQNILREALLLADHNAYHLGQLVMLRKILGGWK
jgi:hypothetical protein